MESIVLFGRILKDQIFLLKGFKELLPGDFLKFFVPMVVIREVDMQRIGPADIFEDSGSTAARFGPAADLLVALGVNGGISAGHGR